MKDEITLREAGILTDIINYVADADINILSDIGKRILNRDQDDPLKFAVDTNIAKAASGLTAVFPVLVTEATELDHAIMVSKAVERKAVALLQMLFAANQITTTSSAQQYLARFHKNMSGAIDLSGMDVDDVIEYTNKLSEEMYPDDEKKRTALNEMTKAVIEDCKRTVKSKQVDFSINESSIGDYKVRTVLNELETWKSNRTVDTIETRTGGLFGQTTRTTTIGDEPDMQDIKNAYEALNKGVIKTDIEKANEAVPSLMIVNFVTIVEGGNKVVNTAVIGVKAKIQYVGSEEMINRLVMKNSDRRGMLNFLRATTGEISFFRDFLFAVDRAKVDAVARSGKGSNSKIWKMLELTAHKAKLNKAAGKRSSDTSAITTIVLSKAEVDLIKKEHRIDLMKAGTMVSIMRGYNLMAACIVDDVAERVMFLYDDGSKTYEILSFMSLEREEGNGMYKKVINLMTKGR